MRMPFPFPHAQMITAVLAIFLLTVPVMIVAFIPNPWLAAFLSFVTQVVYWGTHEVRKQQPMMISTQNDVCYFCINI